jgi:hypothetical protein
MKRMENLVPDWRTTLADAGVTVDVVDANHVRLVAHPDHSADVVAGSLVIQVKTYSYPITPSKLPPPPPEGRGLLVVPSATPSLIKAAQERGWFVVTDDGRANLQIGDRHVLLTGAPTGDSRFPWPTSRAKTRGPISWPRWTLARVLLATCGEPFAQADAAHVVGTSPPTISRAIASLEGQGFVRVKESPGRASTIQVTNWDGLLSWWLMHYPGPGGTHSYWYSLEDLRTQVRSAVAALQATTKSAEAVLSGDLAADYIAPWRRPASATVYVRHAAPLDRAGFVQVAGPGEATLTVCAPKDPGVWMPAPWVLEEDPVQLRLADPIQVLYDLTLAAGPDAGEAADHLRAKLRSDLRPRWAAVRIGRKSRPTKDRRSKEQGADL